MNNTATPTRTKLSDALGVEFIETFYAGAPNRALTAASSEHETPRRGRFIVASTGKPGTLTPPLSGDGYREPGGSKVRWQRRVGRALRATASAPPRQDRRERHRRLGLNSACRRRVPAERTLACKRRRRSGGHSWAQIASFVGVSQVWGLACPSAATCEAVGDFNSAGVVVRTTNAARAGRTSRYPPALAN